MRSVLVSLFCLGLVGCDEDLVHGNGQAAQETRTVATFEEAVVENGLGLELVASGAAGDVDLAVSGDENLLELVETTVAGGRLTVRAKRPFATELGLVVRGAAPALLRIGAAGGSTAVAREVARSGTFETTVAGGSRVAISGTAGRLDALVSGGSVLAARELTAAEVRILDASGGSVVEVCATDTLFASASGGSTVTYACEPERIEPVVSGGAVVRPATP